MNTNSALYVGRVRHQRLRPTRHRLGYRVFSLLLDVDELPTLSKRLRFFSLNRFNLFSLHERDYGAGDGQTLRAYVDGLLLAADLQAGGSVLLLSMPHILGYAFNPLSVYFCHRPEGGLQAVIYEVHNTFGERHSYLVEVAAGERDAPAITQRCEKTFYVSPFVGMDGEYTVRVRDKPSGLSIAINERQAGAPLLATSLVLERRRLTNRLVLRMLVRYPFMTQRTTALIHWHALRLWRRGLPFRRHGDTKGRVAELARNHGPVAR